MQPERNDVDYLFELALKKLGPLDSDEMYAFVPALALGGSMELKNLKKVKPLSTLSFPSSHRFRIGAFLKFDHFCDGGALVAGFNISPKHLDQI